ncbi:sodium-coupled monocarboxylate transporter 1-like isoform X1 [Lytechinus pictus]
MEEVLRFSVWDYVVFGVMLVLSAAIGVYSAFSDGRQRTSEEIILGNRKLNPIPVGLSIMATLISAVAIIGTPGEIYSYNTMLMWGLVAYVPACILVALLFLPLYFRIQITSVNEYLELRFNRALRVLATCSLLLSTGLYMGIATYAPALAISAVTGMSLWTSILTTGAACTFYTSLGGIKAIVWTDTMQSVIMIAGVVAVIVKGTFDIGSIDEVWRRGVEGERIRFLELNPDPTIIYSVWTVLIGLSVGHARLGITQIMAQRLISCGNRNKAAQALFISTIGYCVLMLLMEISGVVMYAYFYGCDPLTSGRVQSQDQIMPLMVMELFRDMPGIPGLFLSAVAAGSLSSLSSGMNALATVTAEDIIKPLFPKMKPGHYAWLLKGLTVFQGGTTLMFAYLTGLLGTGVVQVSFSVAGIPVGSLLGVFLLGVYFHRCNGKGALAGFLGSIMFVCWMRIGAIFHPNSRGRSPVSIDDCPSLNESTTELFTSMGSEFMTLSSDPMQSAATTVVPEEPSGLVHLYHVSFYYYYPIALILTIVIAMVVSAITGFQDPSTIDPNLIEHFTDALFWYLPESVKFRMRCGSPPIKRDSPPPWETKEVDTKEAKVNGTEMKEINGQGFNNSFMNDDEQNEI